MLHLKRREPIPWAKVFCAAALGSLGFAFLRWSLVGLSRNDLVWFAFREEVTELVFVAGAALVLWVFRAGLLCEEQEGEISAGAWPP